MILVEMYGKSKLEAGKLVTDFLINLFLNFEKFKSKQKYFSFPKNVELKET